MADDRCGCCCDYRDVLADHWGAALGPETRLAENPVDHALEDPDLAGPDHVRPGDHENRVVAVGHVTPMAWALVEALWARLSVLLAVLVTRLF